MKVISRSLSPGMAPVIVGALLLLFSFLEGRPRGRSFHETGRKTPTGAEAVGFGM